MAETDTDMDRHTRILKRVIMGLTPLEDETPTETKERKQLEVEVAEIRASGHVPTIPFD